MLATVSTPDIVHLSEIGQSGVQWLLLSHSVQAQVKSAQ